jgi:uncharacterized protein YjbI with pentapeptide repeats
VLLISGAIALGVVLVVAVVLLRSADNHDAPRAQFGRPLLVGAVVGLAFVPVQAATQVELRRSDRERQREDAAESARRELLLQITLRNELRGIDLQGVKLTGKYLYGKDLAGANLRDADLREANLSYADLRSADLTGTRLDDAMLVGVKFDGATLSDTSFVGADLRSAVFRRHEWRGDPDVDLFVKTLHAQFEKQHRGPPPADFSRADLTRATFESSDLSGARFAGAKLLGTKFDDMILEAADFSGAEMTTLMDRVDLCKASFAGAAFDQVAFSDVSYRFADMRDLRFNAGGVVDGDFRGATLEGLQLPAGLPAPSRGDAALDDPINGIGSVYTRGASELPTDLSKRLRARPADPAPAGQCSWRIAHNRLRPRATEPRSTGP